MMAVAAEDLSVNLRLANKRLVDDRLWKRLVNRIVMDEQLDRQVAERIMDQALGFLQLCAIEPDGAYSPSPLVDIGWHTFILYTREYAEFCDRLAGFFIHHAPADDESKGSSRGHEFDTASAMRAHGISPDGDLWTTGAECSHKKCYSCTTGHK
jgi:hypothetical protein